MIQKEKKTSLDHQILRMHRKVGGVNEIQTVMITSEQQNVIYGAEVKSPLLLCV